MVVYNKMDMRGHLAGRFKVFCAFSITFIATCLFLYFYIFNSKLIVTYDVDENFDHLVFTQQWMPTYDKDLKIQNWTIHGLWPSNFNGNNPSFCNNITFEPHQIENLRNDMVKNWPSNEVKSGDIFEGSLKFWSHEWEKHGTCAMSLGSLKSEMEYFRTGLDLHEKYGMLTLLSLAGFSPSLSTKYNVIDMVDKLTELVGKSPSIKCASNNVLGQIGICMDTGFNIIDCPESVTACNLTRPIIYAPIFEVPQFDSIVFRQQWLPTYNNSMKSEWTVHGIWPQLNQICPNITLDISEIESIQANLTNDWPSYNSDDKKFWSHEWLKHGTCALSAPELAWPLNYFSKGIELRQKYNISKILMDANITAAENKVYELKDIQTAFTTAVKITCKDESIAEIGICMDKSLNPINCTDTNSNCGTAKLVKYEPSPPKSWDTVVLAQQWFPAFNKKLKLSNWTVNYFRPQYIDGTTPSNCYGVRFSENAMGLERNDYVRYWPSIKSENDSLIFESSFSHWRKEWNTFGKCILKLQGPKHAPLVNLFDYSEMLFRLYQQLNIFAALDEANIKPTSNQVYHMTDIKNAITKKYNVTSMVNCIEGNILSEVKICFDPHYNPTSCPKETSTCTAEKLRYIPL